MQVIKPNDIAFTDGSFSRSTTGTYIEDGVVKTAGVNVPRFQGGALLLEGVGTNLLTYSEQFDNAAWVKTTLSVTANSAVAPDGTNTADLLVMNNTLNDDFYIGQNYPGWTQGLIYAQTWFVKPAGITWIQVTGSTGTNTSLYRNINITTGELGNGNYSPESIAVTGIDNGWYIVSVSQEATLTSASGRFLLALLTSDVTTRLTNCDGDGTSGIYLWGAQLEASSTPTSYIPTTTAVVTRSADVITGSNLVYTTATDSTSIWVSSATYSLGAKVRTLGKVYESLQNSNLNNPPATSLTFWLYLYPDNMHASLDNVISTASTATETLTFIVKPGKLDSVALINVDSPVVEVSVIDPATGDVIFKSTLGLTGAEVYDWYQYFFFDPVSKRTQIILGGINNTFANAVVAIRLLGAAATTVSIGSSIFGNTTKLGGTQYGATSGIVDYSKKETDEFGTITFVERAFSKRLSADIHFPNNQLNTVQRFLYSIRATPVVWVASDDPEFEEALVVYGFYRDFSSTIAYPTHTLCSLEIEGLT